MYYTNDGSRNKIQLCVQRTTGLWALDSLGSLGTLGSELWTLGSGWSLGSGLWALGSLGSLWALWALMHITLHYTTRYFYHVVVVVASAFSASTRGHTSQA